MYEKVAVKEIIKNQTIPYDLFDEKGTKICSEGEEINKDIIEKLHSFELYKLNKIMLDEDNIIHFEEIKSCISQDTKDFVVSTVKCFLDYFNPDSETNTINVQDCLDSRDQLVDEVQYNLSKGVDPKTLRISAEYKFSHSVNVLNLSTALGIQLGLTEQQLKDLALSAMLADVGMAQIPKDILTNPGRLNAIERKEMQEHCIFGFKTILDSFGLPDKIAVGALDHHENYDGTGYPRKIGLDKISLFGQVIAVCDTFDAIVSDKVYARARSHKDAINIILRTHGRFNPRVAITFAHMININTGDIKLSRLY